MISVSATLVAECRWESADANDSTSESSPCCAAHDSYADSPLLPSSAQSACGRGRRMSASSSDDDAAMSVLEEWLRW